MYKITCTEEKFLISNQFQFDFDVQYQGYAQLSQSQFEHDIRDQDVLIVNELQVSPIIYRHNPELKLIALCSTGYEHIDLRLAQQHGVKVCNVRHYAADSVAEHAMLLMLCLEKNFLHYRQAVYNGAWQASQDFCYLSSQHPIYQLKQKKLVIVGRGDIGQAVAVKAQAFGMQVIYAERPDASSCRVGYVPFWEALAQADVLSLHCPFSTEQPLYIDAHVLARLPSRCMIVNVSRGALIDEEALLNALEHGQIAGYGADVLQQAPPSQQHPLLQPHLNVILTPHIAWAAQEAQQCLFTMLNANINLNLQGIAHNLLTDLQSQAS